MARRKHIDSPEEVSRIMQAAHKKILPPECVPLDDCDMPFFEAVIAEFARAEWTEHSLQLAASLARSLADLVRCQIQLRSEGETAYSEKGTPVINPLKTAVQMYSSTILSMRRSLALHARAQSGTNNEAGKRHNLAKRAEENSAEDDFIGRADGNA